MSIHDKRKFECPNCKKEYDITVWGSLNADLDPEAAKALMDGTLFDNTCPHCGHKARVVYPMLYHDMKNKLWIQFGPEITPEEMEKTLSTADGSSLMGADYKYRLVKSVQELVEKINIFTSGLDDRVIELIKAVQRAAYQEQLGKKLPPMVLLNEEKDRSKLKLLLLEEPLKVLPLPAEMYDKVKSQWGKSFSNGRKDNYVIDDKWVMDFLTKG